MLHVALLVVVLWLQCHASSSIGNLATCHISWHCHCHSISVVAFCPPPKENNNQPEDSLQSSPLMLHIKNTINLHHMHSAKHRNTFEGIDGMITIIHNMPNFSFNIIALIVLSFHKPLYLKQTNPSWVHLLPIFMNIKVRQFQPHDYFFPLVVFSFLELSDNMHTECKTECCRFSGIPEYYCLQNFLLCSN